MLGIVGFDLEIRKEERYWVINNMIYEKKGDLEKGEKIDYLRERM